VISLLFNYYTDTIQDDPESPKLSMYAMGEDYHFVIKRKLFLFLDQIRLQIGDVEGRVFVDSAPIMDKAWAKRSGLGWIGKNSNLINKQQGSFFFIAELILDLNLEADGPIKDYCGSCTRCIDACPTEAIVEPHVVNGSKCISYFTIELKEQIPSSWKGKFDDWMFGCDVCQEVCPFNQGRDSQPLRASVTPISDFYPRNLPTVDAIETMSEAEWDESFRGSAMRRAGYEGLRRNVRALRNDKK
jgi:epoxyqueuosine reductase